MWITVAEGRSDNIPDVQLQPGKEYRLVISLPFSVPGLSLVVGPIRSALGALGIAVQSVNVSGADIDIAFTT